MRSPSRRTFALLTVLALGALTTAGCGSSSATKTTGSALAKSSPSDATPSKQVTIRCPKGSYAVGGGAHLHFPGEPGGVVPLAITQSRPNPDESARPTGWTAAANATGAFTSNWGIEVHVICSR